MNSVDYFTSEVLDACRKTSAASNTIAVSTPTGLNPIASFIDSYQTATTIEELLNTHFYGASVELIQELLATHNPELLV